MRSPLRSPAQVEGPQGVLPQPEKDLERQEEASQKDWLYRGVLTPPTKDLAVLVLL